MATIKFENDSIIIFKGNTYPHLGWFRNSGAVYNPLFGWFFQKMEDLPVDYPDELEPLVLPVADITNNAGILKADQEIKEVVESILYPEEEWTGEFVGYVKERIEVYIILERAVSLANYGSASTLFIMNDDLGNTYCWTTACNPPMVEGETYKIRGTIKDHRVYKGHRQNILTRCKIM